MIAKTIYMVPISVRVPLEPLHFLGPLHEENAKTSKVSMTHVIFSFFIMQIYLILVDIWQTQ